MTSFFSLNELYVCVRMPSLPFSHLGLMSGALAARLVSFSAFSLLRSPLPDLRSFLRVPRSERPAAPQPPPHSVLLFPLFLLLSASSTLRTSHVLTDAQSDTSGWAVGVPTGPSARLRARTLWTRTATPTGGGLWRQGRRSGRPVQRERGAAGGWCLSVKTHWLDLSSNI